MTVSNTAGSYVVPNTDPNAENRPSIVDSLRTWAKVDNQPGHLYPIQKAKKAFGIEEPPSHYLDVKGERALLEAIADAVAQEKNDIVTAQASSAHHTIRIYAETHGMPMEDHENITAWLERNFMRRPTIDGKPVKQGDLVLDKFDNREHHVIATGFIENEPHVLFHHDNGNIEWVNAKALAWPKPITLKYTSKEKRITAWQLDQTHTSPNWVLSLQIHTNLPACDKHYATATTIGGGKFDMAEGDYLILTGDNVVYLNKYAFNTLYVQDDDQLHVAVANVE